MKKGQVFTPDKIVEKMLNYVDFKNIKQFKILEPSFGQGVFIKHMLYRLIDMLNSGFIKEKEFYKIINNNIHGVELDTKLYKDTILNLNNILQENKLKETAWSSLVNMDFIDYEANHKFDYIIGNPPYIKIQDIDKPNLEKIKKYNFTKGNTDLYVFFFEKCIMDLLDDSGRLIFISPNSYFKNTSQRAFRNYLKKEKLIEEIIDFGHNLIFEGVLTYTCISIISQNNDSFIYKTSDGSKIISSNNYDTSKLLDFWYFSSDKDFLEKRFYSSNESLSDFINCQYGVATNRDKVYISKNTSKTNSFNKLGLEKKYIRPAVKASRYDGDIIDYSIIYPYINNSIVSEDDLKTSKKLYEYLLSKKDDLSKRSMEANQPWFAFARSQGIKTMDNEKLVFKHNISSDINKIIAHKLDSNTVVFSGIYITSDYDLDVIKGILETSDFIDYLRIVGKDMQGGYKSISAKHVLDYKLTDKEIEKIKNSL